MVVVYDWIAQVVDVGFLLASSRSISSFVLGFNWIQVWTSGVTVLVDCLFSL